MKDFKIEVEQVAGWSFALDAARETMHKESNHAEPSEQWKLRMLFAEHSPIRLVEYKVRLINIPSWVSVHLVRHHIGIEKFVSTQRTDRTGINRNELRQDEPVNMSFVINAQALINISRVRLCFQTSPETRLVWERVISAIAEIDNVIGIVCVPNCIYRSICPEIKCCGYNASDSCKSRMIEYKQHKNKLLL